MFKRIISVLLTAALTLGAFAVTAYADGRDAALDPEKLYVSWGDDNYLELKKGETFYILCYTVSALRPVGYADGGIWFTSESIDFLDRKVCYSSVKDGQLMMGTFNGSSYQGSQKFEIKPRETDISMFGQFLQNMPWGNGITLPTYIQPMAVFKAQMRVTSGVYNIKPYMDCARDLDGSLMISKKYNYHDKHMSYGVICVKDDPMGIRGDADGDGVITVIDATRIQRYLSGMADEKDINTVSADADMDGSVTIMDATRIQRALADLCDMNGNDMVEPTKPEPIEPAEPEPPAVPVITKIESGNKGVTVTWDAFPGAEMYRIFCKTGGNSWKKLTDTSATSYIHADAPYDTECVYTVRCVDKNGSFTSDYDKVGYANIRLKNPVLKSVKLMDSFIGLSWDSVQGAAAYRIYIKGGSFTSWTWVLDSDLNYVDINTEWIELESNTAYSFTVRCVNGLRGERLLSGYDTKGLTLTYYDTPEIFWMVCKTEGIELYWSEVEGAAAYRLFEWADGSWKKLTDTEYSAIRVTGVRPPAIFRFTVRGLDSDGNYITPYDSFGREVVYAGNYHVTRYDADSIIGQVETAIDEAGFSTGEVPLAEGEIRSFFLDGTPFYQGAVLDRSIVDRSKAVIEKIAKMINRNGEPTSNYYCTVEVEADEDDGLWFYIVYTRRADVD